MKSEFIKKGEEKEKKEVNGKLFRLLQKSTAMESIIAELDIGVESEIYRHKGEEVHLVLRGKIEYQVGDELYTIQEGDVLWHTSKVNHRARNIGDGKAVYITISSPPTFM